MEIFLNFEYFKSVCLFSHLLIYWVCFYNTKIDKETSEDNTKQMRHVDRSNEILVNLG